MTAGKPQPRPPARLRTAQPLARTDSPATTAEASPPAAKAAKVPAAKVPAKPRAAAPPPPPRQDAARATATPTAGPPPVAAASALAATASTVPLGDEDGAEPRRGYSFLLFQATPAWAVSMGVHFVLLIALALWPLAQMVEQSREIVLLPDDAQEEPAVFEPMKFEVQDLDVQEISTESFASGDIGMANLGSPAEFVPSTSMVGMASMENVGDDIGLLFGEDGKGMADVGAGYGGAQFFGVKAGGRKFVFIVDSSKSMGGGKFDAARYELTQAVRRLSEDQLFYVIFFDWDANRLRLGEWNQRLGRWSPNDEPEERAVLASNENKAHVEQWMETVELELKTLVLESFEHAMEMYPDAIYVLTDGRFGDTKRVEKYLAENNYIVDEFGNKQPKVIIHTVGFYNRDGEAVLEKMAKDYGGTYRFVPDPREKPGMKKKK
ncbi:MAG: VWA domain-containing protein [Pirellulaceae bacterium]